MNKKILVLIMTFAMILTTWSVVYAEPSPEDEGADTHTCSGGSWYKDGSKHKKKCSTCSEVYDSEDHSGGTWIKGETQHYKKCETCDGYYSYSDHGYGSWNLSSSQPGKHYKKCSTCDKYVYEDHGGGQYYAAYNGSTATHYKDCSSCSKKKYTSSTSHNTDHLLTYEEAVSEGITYNNTYHKKCCSICWNSLTDAINQTNETHTKSDWYAAYNGSVATHYQDCTVCAKPKIASSTNHDQTHLLLDSEAISEGRTTSDETHVMCCALCWDDLTDVINETSVPHGGWSGGEEPTVHTCTECFHPMSEGNSKRFHYYDCSEGMVLEYAQTRFRCKLKNCPGTVSILQGTFQDLKGLHATEYVASDASIEMDAIPTLNHGTYTLYWKYTDGGSGTPVFRDMNGNVISYPQLCPSWITLEGWTQRTLRSHVKLAEGYAEEYREHVFAMDKWYEWDNANNLVDSFKNEEYVTQMLNRAADNPAKGWLGVMQTRVYDAIKNDREPYTPEYTMEGATYNIKYEHPTGGWMFKMNPFFNSEGGSTYFTDLFVYGDYEKEEPEEWYANIFYCYMTTDGEKPKNELPGVTPYKEVLVYYDGNKYEVTKKLTPNKTKIDNSGYRYVGYTTQVGPVNSLNPATSCANVGKEQASVTVAWDYERAGALVTFFVEPVKLSYGHKAIDYNGNLIDINISSHEGENLEFPNYYIKDEHKCIIPKSTAFDPNVIEPLESIHKFYYPGYILESSKVYKVVNGAETTTVINGSEKIYTDETTTNLDGSPPRYVVNERVPSFYSTESRGYASDKKFYFFYNTPTIKIEHKKYGTNEFMKTIDNKNIEYLQQIINQYAYIESLITDNVNLPHTLNASLATGGISSFSYACPTYDLVQIKIYEIKGGSNNLYATLYADEEYNDREKSKKVTNYQGNFAEYYSESLNAIAAQIGANSNAFNTNRNWKVEFIYDEVERVYIRFMDLKGNNIFIPDPSNPGKYLQSITEKIPQSGYTYTPTDLGENGKFKLVSYTLSGDNYEKDSTKGTAISSGTPVTVPGNNGDKYIVFFYSTDKMITVEYRDMNETTIRPSIQMEIPVTGTVVKVPDINLYDVVGYKYNQNYVAPGDTIGTDANGNTIYGINGELRELTSDDTEISVMNPNETNQHLIIYYKSKESLKVEYRDINGDMPLPVPPEYVVETMIEIPELGTNIFVPTVPGYEVRYYLKNDNYNGTDTTITGTQNATTEGSKVSITPNGNNQFVIIYYEKVKETTKLTIEFREETPTGPILKPTVVIDIPNGETTPVAIPEIPEFIPKSYVKNNDPETPITPGVEITVVGDPVTGNQKVIIIYTSTEEPEEPEIPVPPTIITPEDNKEKVILRANQSNSEEYNVDLAIPTSEDLYVSGEIYSYRFDTEMHQKDYTEYINVKINQPYYTDLDNPADKDYISVELTIPLTYRYYEIVKADLYDLKSTKLENSAIKYYNDYDYATQTSGGYKEGEANFPVVKNKPYLEFNEPTGIGTGTAGANARIQINSTDAYTVTYSSGVYNITINDVDYYEALNRTALENQLISEATTILEKCTKIKVQTLNINVENETNVVEILTGGLYDLPNKEEALDSTDYYIPYVAGRTPLYSFKHDKDLYVQEKAENKMHLSTVTGNYILIESMVTGTAQLGDKLNVEKINANALNIHTPIVNKVTLTPSEINKNSIQLEPTINVSSSSTAIPTTILNLEELFTIEIANSGNHVNHTGYGDGKVYNHGGLTANGDDNTDSSTTSRINPKSNDELMNVGIFVNNGGTVSINTANVDTEKEAKGPSFAEYKLIKFPYDVYLISGDKGESVKPKYRKDGVEKETSILFKANEWYNLYEYLAPSITKYTFAIPTWVKDATLYADQNGIQVLVVAENCSESRLLDAMNSSSILTAVKNSESNETGKNNTYILRTTFNTYVAGRIYDLQVRDTDDPGYMGKLSNALSGDKTSETTEKELPLAQQGQVKAYNMGLKLGYRIYFDLKTKGISNKTVIIKPKIYYVPKSGSPTDNITLFYHSKGSLYNRLDTSDLNIKMTLAGTHGLVNNPEYTKETISAKQILASRVFTNTSTIGKIFDGLTLKRETEKLPYDNLEELAKICGFTETTAISDLITSALASESIPDTDTNGNTIKNSAGHWYGEYYLPASTIVVPGNNVNKQAVINGTINPYTTGYLVVVFEKITTEDDVKEGDGYLTYSMPSSPKESQWKKEGIETIIKLPTGETSTIVTERITEAAPMVIYQVGLRANNDYETEGTH